VLEKMNTPTQNCVKIGTYMSIFKIRIHPASYTMGIEGSFSGVKASEA
jgi:hypothetical protein